MSGGIRTARGPWRRAVMAHRFKPAMRPVKATLLSLPMEADGTVRLWREELVAATGLPVGTLKRHLAAAVEEDWLEHESRGGQGRRGVYRGTVPGNSGPRVSRYPVNSGPSIDPLSTGIVAHLVGQSVKKEPERSEVQAVDQDREQQGDHNASRDERDRNASRTETAHRGTGHDDTTEAPCQLFVAAPSHCPTTPERDRPPRVRHGARQVTHSLAGVPR